MNKALYDILQSSDNLQTEDIILRILISVFFAVMIYVSYQITHSGSVYSKKFNVTLVVLTILTTMVMTVIGNNVALSLGMVGALSIIRFRTSVKDSRDTIYIFWAIIIGICCGVGDFLVAGIGSAVVFLLLLAFGRVKNENRILLVIRADRHQETNIQSTLFNYFPKPPLLKVQNTTADKIEMIYELNRRMLTLAEKKSSELAIIENKDETTLTDKLYQLGGIDYVNIVSQSDEIS